MKVFTNGDVDWVVAENVDDAWEVYLAHSGGEREDFDGQELEEVPGDEPLKIWCGDDGHPTEPHSDGSALVTQRAEQWAAQEPRGFLGSTEY